MSVINFQESLRTRISQMADEHMQMQEAIMYLPEHQVAAACAALDRHSARLSRLAARLQGAGAVPIVPAVPAVPTVADPNSVLNPQSSSLSSPEDL